METKDELKKELVTREIFEEAQKSAGREMLLSASLNLQQEHSGKLTYGVRRKMRSR